METPVKYEVGDRVVLLNNGGYPEQDGYVEGAKGTVEWVSPGQTLVKVDVDYSADAYSLTFFTENDDIPEVRLVSEEGPQPPEGNRQSILDEASKLIHGDRAADYGDACKMHQKIGDLWAAYLGLEGGIRADQVAIMMALMKISRSTSSPKFDTYVDLAGYAALGGEMAIQGQ